MTAIPAIAQNIAKDMALDLVYLFRHIYDWDLRAGIGAIVYGSHWRTIEVNDDRRKMEIKDYMDAFDLYSKLSNKLTFDQWFHHIRADVEYEDDELKCLWL